MEDKLTLELLKEIKHTSKRWCVLFVITLSMLFLTNIAWLIVWSLPATETTTSYEVESQDGHAVYNGQGEVNINGTSQGN